MLVATALAVASLGAIGVLGPLGSLIAGEGTVLERASDPSSRDRGDDAPIVADSSPLAPATTSENGTARVRTPARPVRHHPGGDAPSSTTGPGPRAPAPRPPGAQPGTPVPPTPPPAPPQRPAVVSAATDTIRTTAAQLPPAAKPAGDALAGLADTVDETCGRLSLCP